MASSSAPSSKESISPQSSSKSSLPAKNATQRIRPGILSRQASEREEGDAASGYLHSASEDDDARYSDTNSLPRRFATNSTNLGSSTSKGKVNQSPVPHLGASDLGSSQHSLAYSSGGEASSSSSRLHQPLQSRTSLYSRQVSGESYSRGDVSEDGSSAWNSSGTYPAGSNSLNRAKSVSSVSSVNSTSSMEAVPFRAAPLGNVRPGYAGYAKGQNTAATHDGDSKASKEGRTQMQQGSTPNEEVASGPLSQTGSVKQRVLPKGPSDDWLYRNAPGMGAKSNARNGMPTYHTIATTRGMSRAPMPFSSEGTSQQVAIGFDDEGDESSPAMSQHISRMKPSIRSKLAKRAGKLGLKPLTSMAIPTDGALVSYALPSSSSQVSALRSSSSDGREDNALSLDAATMPSISLTPSSSRLSAELKATRSGKAYLSNPPMGSLPVFGADAEPMKRTSSVTYAPLVVQKNPPGPPGSGPAPSPGLIGPPSPFYPFSLASPKVSPQRLSDEVDPITLQANQMTLGDVEGARRPAKASFDASYLAGTGQRGERGHQRLSFSTPAHTRPGQSDAQEVADITPAQQIQKDARAGIARAPAEPSGATPGPNPAAMSTDSDEETTLGGMPRTRPHSFSLSTQQTVRAAPQQQPQPYWGSNSISKSTARRLSSSGASSGSKRPGLLRAMTSESGLVRSNIASGDDNHPLIKGVSVDESSGVSNYWSGRPTRNGGASPIDSSSSSHSGEAGGDRTSGLRLDIPPEGLALTSPSKRLLNPSPSAMTPSSELTVQQTPMPWKRNSPDVVTKPLPSIQESRQTDEISLLAPRNAEDASDKETLPSTAVSSASVSLAPVEIKHPHPDPGDPGRYIPHPEVISTPEITGVDALESSKGASAPLLSVSPATQDKPNRGRAASATRSIRVESDFVFGDILGEGSYSTVMEAWDVKPIRDRDEARWKKEMEDAKIESGAMDAMVGKALSAKQRASMQGAKAYAVKVLDKVHILKEKKQKYVALEREALSLLIRHPGVVTLFWTFQNRDSLYFVLELAPNGELLTAIKKLGSFNVECARYYGAQLVDTIQGIHDAGVLHRDLKPENVLLDAEMKIKVTDFGSAKVVKAGEASKNTTSEDAATERPRASSFVGTAEYVSPELLNDKQVSEASDWWAFGCLLYQMLCGKPPFKGISEYQTFQKIIKGDFECPAGMSSEAVSLIRSILVLDPDQRFKVAEIKQHPFFHLVDWNTVWQIEAPKLEAGIYVRSTPAPSSSSSLNHSAKSVVSRDNQSDNDLVSEDGGRSGVSSVPEFNSSATFAASGASAGVDADRGEAQDADDDDSSLSESRGDGLSPRRRGFSSSASAAERMQKEIKFSMPSSSSKRASNFFRMAAGLSPAPSDGKLEASAGSSESSTPSRGSLALRPSSRKGSAANLRQLQSSSSIGGSTPSQQGQGNRLSMPTSFLANELTKSTAFRDSKYGSTSEKQFHTLLATSWAALLLPNESLLYSCPILHRTTGALLRSNTKKRQLLLTDFPRLLCVKETNDQLKVKSEVILGLPRVVPTQGRIGYSFQGNDDDDDEEEDDEAAQEGTEGGFEDGEDGEGSSTRGGGKTSQQRRNSHNPVPKMQRQSSAGPLLGSPARPRSYGNTAASSTVPNRLSGARWDVERRDSYPFVPSKQQQWLAAAPSGSAFSHRYQQPPNQPQSSQSQSQSQSQQQQQQQQQEQQQIINAHHPLPLVDASPNIMTAIEQRSIRTFLVVTPAKSFLYEDPSGDATHWVKSICTAAATKSRSTTTGGDATYSR